MNRSGSISALAAALAKAQQAFLPIKRTERVAFGANEKRRAYNYAPLDEVINATRKALSDNELAIMQPTHVEDGKLFVETWLCHSSGEWVSCEMYVGDCNQTPQTEGSALTYKRRYSLTSLLGIASEEDDDAEAAQAKVGERSNVPPDQTGHWCEKDGVAFTRHTNPKGEVWWSHKKADGTWCNEPAAPTGAQAEASHPVEGEQSDVETAIRDTLIRRINAGFAYLKWDAERQLLFRAAFSGEEEAAPTLEELNSTQLQEAFSRIKNEAASKMEAREELPY